MDVEQRIRERLGSGDLAAAATLGVERYGREVRAFLIRLLRDVPEATDVYAQACADMWSGLGNFQGRSSFRSWFYVIARHAAARSLRAPHKAICFLDGVDALDTSELSDVDCGTCSSVEAQTWFTQFWRALPEQDQVLLRLRVAEELGFRDVARAFLNNDATAQELTREAARLRKRFQHLKEGMRYRAHWSNSQDP
jgi:RNA polymerase sigma factor (sigma-70 family)